MGDGVHIDDIDALLRACPATRHLAGRVRAIRFLAPDGTEETGFDAKDLAAMLRELHVVVDFAPPHAITAPVRAIAENSRRFIDGIEAFAKHGMDACGRGDA